MNALLFVSYFSKMNFTILHFDSLASTNTEATNQAKRGAGEGLCIVAGRQTEGRGRFGREWISQKDAGVYFSIVLRPKIAVKYLPLMTFACAVAVFETLSKFGLNPDIKWANDVHVEGKKICGILAETCETNVGLAVIVGIGINLKSANFPPELKEIATSIEQETGTTPDAEVLLQTLTGFLSVYCEILYGENGVEKIRQEWMRRSSYARGKSVRVRLSNKTISGKTCGIESDGALRVRTESGEVKTVRAGDVEKLRTEKQHISI